MHKLSSLTRRGEREKIEHYIHALLFMFRANPYEYQQAGIKLTTTKQTSGSRMKFPLFKAELP
jgi:hypothetical protein